MAVLWANLEVLYIDLNFITSFWGGAVINPVPSTAPETEECLQVLQLARAESGFESRQCVSRAWLVTTTMRALVCGTRACSGQGTPSCWMSWHSVLSAPSPPQGSHTWACARDTWEPLKSRKTPLTWSSLDIFQWFR